MVSVVQLGTIDYATGLRLQQQLVALRKEEKIGDALLLLEHKPVITLGRNAKAANVVASAELLKKRGVELFECDRGGDVTFHGPGQIVGYPIFDLRGFARVGADALVRPGESRPSLRKTLGVIEFVRRLEEVLMRTCADFAVPTRRVAGLTGVWTDPESTLSRGGADATVRLGESKIRPDHPNPTVGLRPAGTDECVRPYPIEAKLAAIGVHVSRFVTSHGFALNVNTDLSYFNLIVPCGIPSKPVTSMRQELGRALDLNAVAESISRNFGVVFQTQIVWVDTLDALLGRAVGVPVKPPTDLRQLHKEDDTTWA
ncbi:Octanoyltransferase [Candidatus Sulfotelmatobacter kueseliae]|uniref:Octanoyltransferase n=1 Tax=Candidatus Sulfotelmatobacter kueseliae TaxID=2042962 RepID=A0A2U3L1B8_9BACT|nr:Octanoyltransferase [Candidatus Sulfotelmatobacter kueseliae]